MEMVFEMQIENELDINERVHLWSDGTLDICLHDGVIAFTKDEVRELFIAYQKLS